MSETALDTVSIADGGGTETGAFGKPTDVDEVVFVLDGDANSAAIDVSVSSVAFEQDGSLVSPNFTSEVTGLDATTDADNDLGFKLSNLRGWGRVELTVTNSHTSGTTITITETEP